MVGWPAPDQSNSPSVWIGRSSLHTRQTNVDRP